MSHKNHDISDSDEELPSSSTTSTDVGKKRKLLSDDGASNALAGNVVSSRESSDKVGRPACKYGEDCIRQNPAHKRDYWHPPASSKSMKLQRDVEMAKTMPSEKLEDAAPYNFFLTTVSELPRPEHNQHLAIGIRDILDESLGVIQSSVQFNYMFDVQWLMEQYPKNARHKPLLMVHGFKDTSKTALEEDAREFPNVKLSQARLDIPYGTHHTKMMLLQYASGMRVVIHTANLVPNDWHQKTQGVWISPFLPQATNLENSDSPTNFKSDLISYLQSYRLQSLSSIITEIGKCNFSEVKVCLVASIPGRHVTNDNKKLGLPRLQKLLKTHGPDLKEMPGWPIIGQFSSIGSLGSTPDAWLSSQFLDSMASGQGPRSELRRPRLDLIYPTQQDVRCSLEGWLGGSCLPYTQTTHKKQAWIVSFLSSWKSNSRGRTRAIPHVKSYMRINKSGDKAAWILVTSSNLSKAAWGVLEKQGSQLMIRSYELGVLFLPKFFGGQQYIPIMKGSATEKSKEASFSLPFDLPVEHYEDGDIPWLGDVPKLMPDCNGNMWCPPV